MYIYIYYDDHINPGGYCDHWRLYVCLLVCEQLRDQNSTQSSPNLTAMFVYVRNRNQIFLGCPGIGILQISVKVKKKTELF